MAMTLFAQVGLKKVEAATYDYPVSATWSVTYVNVSGAPQSPNVSCDKKIAYSTYGADANMLSHSISVPGANYKATVTCNNGSMSSKWVGWYNNVYHDIAHCNPSYSGIVQYQSYHFVAYTSTSNNTATIGGNVVANS